MRRKSSIRLSNELDNLELESGYDSSRLDILGDSANESPRDEVEEIKKLSKAENVRIRILRLVVAFLLLVAGISVTFATFKLLEREQEQNFKDAYTQYSATLKTSIIRNQREILEAQRTLVDFMAIYTRAGRLKWPFYDFGDHDAIFKEQVEAKGIEGIGVLTKVMYEDTQQFMEYEAKNCDARLRKSHLTAFGHDKWFTPGPGLNASFWDITGEPSPRKEWYSVIRYRYPPMDSCGGAGFLDFNSVPHIQQAVNASLQLRNESVSSTYADYIESTEELQTVHLSVHDQLPGEYKTDFPHSYMFHPIYEKLHDITSSVVGFLFTNVAFDLALHDILPPGVWGIYVVGSNSCGQQFTYRLDGSKAYFIGDGDLHPPGFDSMGLRVDTDLSSHPDFFSTPGHCFYWMTIYPSDPFKQIYVNSIPTIFAISVATSFFIMIITFTLYDLVVQKRNNKLIVLAAKSSKIVTAMFPGDFREKILDQHNDNDNNDDQQVQVNQSGITTVDIVHKTIASVYPETTIMFADLVGFTAWSSLHSPTEVFELLETFFSAFDKLAHPRKVYKVETVGDCYVAATGVPNPDARHAVSMVRFAQECLVTVKDVIRSLEATLGPETSKLNFRVGIHSGSVTAGVMRGERSRFQLFGDTMNTAARMETNGLPGRIHISKQTAAALLAAGKGHWVTKRVDKIVAKGKGELQTYWARTLPEEKLPSGGNTSRTSDDDHVGDE